MTFAGFFRTINKALKKFGDLVSTAVLTFFYFSIFGLFALPARFAGDFLRKRAAGSAFVPRGKQYDSLDSFRHEG